MAANWPMPAGLFGSRSTATRFTAGAISLRSSSHFALMAYSKTEKPVALPPGRPRLSTIPAPTGSATCRNTIGSVRVISRQSPLLGLCPLYPQKRTNIGTAAQRRFVPKADECTGAKTHCDETPVNRLCLIEIDDLDPIAIGVVKIGVPARERGVTLVGIFDEFDATRLHDCKRPIEFLRRYHQRMMM